jgi:hypothetical protein
MISGARICLRVLIESLVKSSGILYNRNNLPTGKHLMPFPSLCLL